MGRVIVVFFLFSIILANQVNAQTTFSPSTNFPTGSNPNSFSAVDFNGDGMPDLAISNYNSNTVSVLLNTTAPGAGVPSFSSNTVFTTGSYPGSVSIGDMNGEGMPDLAVVNGVSNTVSVLLNTPLLGAATPSFTSKTDFAIETKPRAVSICDLNGDGMPDLAVACYSSHAVSVLLNSAVLPLPVELTLFTASATDNKVTLTGIQQQKEIITDLKSKDQF